MKKAQLVEVVKFVIRLGLLVFAPQIAAVLTNSTGAVWANALSVLLPVVDKWVHESDLNAKGLLPF